MWPFAIDIGYSFLDFFEFFQILEWAINWESQNNTIW
jgi:hypothetical protein